MHSLKYFLRIGNNMGNTYGDTFRIKFGYKLFHMVMLKLCLVIFLALSLFFYSCDFFFFPFQVFLWDVGKDLRN